jgi:hypothetical protein
MVIMRKIIKLLLPILLTTTSIHAQETDFSELSSIVDSFIVTKNLTKKELSKLIRKSSLLLLESNIYVKLIEVETEY